MSKKETLEKDLFCKKEDCKWYSWQEKSGEPHCGEGRPITQEMKDCRNLKKKPECYYKCGKPLGDGYFVVIKDGEMVRAHEKCQKEFERAGEVNIRMVIK